MSNESSAGASGTSWIAEVFVSLKPAVNDPQGLAIRDGLHMLGYDEVDEVRAGKYLQLRLDAPDRASAERRVAQMCDSLLANTVIETYRFVLTPDSAHTVAAGE